PSCSATDGDPANTPGSLVASIPSVSNAHFAHAEGAGVGDALRGDRAHAETACGVGNGSCSSAWVIPGQPPARSPRGDTLLLGQPARGPSPVGGADRGLCVHYPRAPSERGHHVRELHQLSSTSLWASTAATISRCSVPGLPSACASAMSSLTEAQRFRCHLPGRW